MYFFESRDTAFRNDSSTGKSEQRKEKNRLAARKCRQRKQETMLALEDEVQKLQIEKRALENQMKQLQTNMDSVTQERRALFDTACRAGLLPRVQEMLQEQLAFNAAKANKDQQSENSSQDHEQLCDDVVQQGAPGVITTGMIQNPNRKRCRTPPLEQFRDQPIKMSKPAVITNYSYVSRHKSKDHICSLSRQEDESADSNYIDSLLDEDLQDLLIAID